jgi:hypothetical protein
MFERFGDALVRDAVLGAPSQALSGELTCAVAGVGACSSTISS